MHQTTGIVGVAAVCHDRTIAVVRDKIKAFAQKKVTLPPGKHKIIILDEADRYGVPCMMVTTVLLMLHNRRLEERWKYIHQRLDLH